MMLWWILLGLLIAFVLVLLVRTLRFHPVKATAPAPVTVAVDADEAARNLSAMVRCQTVSHPDQALDDEKEFAQFTALLPTLFPKVFATCSFETVGDRGLMLHWQSKSNLAPLVLTAHYDVVPADASVWEKPPFSGDIENGIIYGRGTLDTKCTLSAILNAAEMLIQQGYTPDRDIYFCFAGNEEVMGSGAPGIVDVLEERGVHPLMVLDEGGAIVEKVFPGVAQPCALIGIAEKGSVNYKVTARALGGHSSAPLPHTPVDMLARACLAILKKPFPFRATVPAKQLINGLARHSTFAYRLLFANLWAFSPLLDLVCRKSGGELNALFRTTIAFTMLNAGESANVMPAAAQMTLNARVLPGESVEGTFAALQRKIGDENAQVELLQGFSPSGCSDTDGEGYARLQKTIGEVFPGVLVSPYMMIACSDARHYERICKHVYRFTGMALSGVERRMIHGANEQIPIAKQADTVRFYLRLMQNVCS